MLEIAADLRGWQKWESLWEPIDDDLYLKRPPTRVAQQLPHMISKMCILLAGGIFGAMKRCTKITFSCWFQVTDYWYQFIL